MRGPSYTNVRLHVRARTYRLHRTGGNALRLVKSRGSTERRKPTDNNMKHRNLHVGHPVRAAGRGYALRRCITTSRAARGAGQRHVRLRLRVSGRYVEAAGLERGKRHRDKKIFPLLTFGARHQTGSESQDLPSASATAE